MSDNPYLNGGVPLNDSDLTNDADNSKSEFFASLMSIKRLKEQHKNSINKNVNNFVETTQTPQSGSAPTSTYQIKSGAPQNNQPVYSDSVAPANNAQNYNSTVTQPQGEYIPYDYRTQQPDQNSGYEPYPTENPQYNQQPVDQFSNAPQNNEQPKYTVDGKDGKNKKKKQKGEVKDNRVPAYCSDGDIKKGKKVAWLAYILFFLPLLFAGKNPFVKFHANEGLEINIIDALGVGLILTGYMVKTTNTALSFVLLGSLALGIILIILTTITKIMMIIFSLCGKSVQTPWLWKAQIIKSRK